MIPDLSIGKLPELLVEKAEGAAYPPNQSIDYQIFINYLRDESQICALSTTCRRGHAHRPFSIWLLGKNHFIRIAASVASHGRSGGSGKGGVPSALREAR